MAARMEIIGGTYNSKDQGAGKEPLIFWIQLEGQPVVTFSWWPPPTVCVLINFKQGNYLKTGLRILSDKTAVKSRQDVEFIGNVRSAISEERIRGTIYFLEMCLFLLVYQVNIVFKVR